MTASSWTRAENRDTWATYVPEPPFAMNRDLVKVAREWSEVMRQKNSAVADVQRPASAHQPRGPDGHCSLTQTQLINGFAADALGAHAAWTIDWGHTIDPFTGPAAAPEPRRADELHPTAVARARVEGGFGIVTVPNPLPGRRSARGSSPAS